MNLPYYQMYGLHKLNACSKKVILSLMLSTRPELYAAVPN